MKTQKRLSGLCVRPSPGRGCRRCLPHAYGASDAGYRTNWRDWHRHRRRGSRSDFWLCSGCRRVFSLSAWVAYG